MNYNIHRHQGTRLMVSNISDNPNFSDFFSGAPDIFDLFSLLQHALLDFFVDLILLGNFNLQHSL